MSPFFTIYGAFLLILQYLAGFKVKFNDSSLHLSNGTLEQIGIPSSDFEPAIIDLSVKVRENNRRSSLIILFQSFYMMIFWLTLRQYISGKRTSNAEVGEGERRENLAKIGPFEFYSN